MLTGIIRKITEDITQIRSEKRTHINRYLKWRVPLNCPECFEREKRKKDITVQSCLKRDRTKC